MLAALLVLVASKGAVQAGTTLTVTNLDDSGAGSLRQAIADANPGDTIAFDVAGTITLTSGELGGVSGISKDLTIAGPGADQLTISGNNASRVFTIVGGSVTISGVTVTNGSSADVGGGIYNFGGTVTLNNSTISGNTAPDRGGGIHNEGTLILNNSTVSGNTAASIGGGIYNAGAGTLTLTSSTVSGNSAGSAGSGLGGGVNNFGTLTLTNGTVSGNSAGSDAGGIRNFGPVTLTNSTISGNTARFRGGIQNDSSGTVNLKNSIIAGNTATNSAHCGGSGTLTSQGYNLVQDTSGCTINGVLTGNITGQDPLLGPLQDNSGPTFTHALLSGSPAIAAGNPATPGSGGNACTAKDQRGAGRVGAGCDIGAYEFGGTVPIPSVSQWGLAGLAVLLAGLAYLRLRGRPSYRPA